MTQNFPVIVRCDIIAELSFRTMQHTACRTWQVPDVSETQGERERGGGGGGERGRGRERGRDRES